MIDGVFDTLDTERIQRLQANGVPESRTLDYKEALPGGTDSDRKEFLADVSSFANAAGGDMVYGVVERRENGKQTGVPEAIEGLPGASADFEQRRLENMLRDGILPRLPQLRWRWIEGFPKGPVLVVRVPRSLAGPHMVTFNQHGRFYARNSAGKYALDVFELRAAFLGANAIGERAREFRAERLGRLGAGESPVKLASAALVCVHVIPHAAFRGNTIIDVAKVAGARDYLQPLYGSGYNVTYNLDGVLANDSRRDGESLAYLQIFRNGIIETVNSHLLATYEEQRPTTLPSLTFAAELARFVQRARQLLVLTEAGYPASLLVSLVGAAGGLLGVHQNLTFYQDIHPRPFDRNMLLFREALLTEDDPGIDAFMKPLLDEVWQSAGLERCFDYDKDGNWKPYR